MPWSCAGRASDQSARDSIESQVSPRDEKVRRGIAQIEATIASPVVDVARHAGLGSRVGLSLGTTRVRTTG